MMHCIGCSIKLCAPCAKGHKNVPITRDHEVEDLSTLTPSQLAARRRSPCVNHSDTPAEMFCPSHASLICLQCLTDHGLCGVQSVTSVAQQERASLNERASKLRRLEHEIVGKVGHMGCCERITLFIITVIIIVIVIIIIIIIIISHLGPGSTSRWWTPGCSPTRVTKLRPPLSLFLCLFLPYRSLHLYSFPP